MWFPECLIASKSDFCCGRQKSRVVQGDKIQDAAEFFARILT